ncbi:MAG TPA: hypothetical protein VFQ61_26630 [Polyangiaceae bacterium]|nr:hypothetical protein [Polyangiaceae bacterium]
MSVFHVRKVRMFGLALALGVAACDGLPRDEGQIWTCFGLVHETAPGRHEQSPLYYGGCSPDDPGLQFVTYARQAASEAEVIAACDRSCGDAFARYFRTHPEAALPLSCETFFVTPCEDPRLGADLTRLPANLNADYFSGGPADFRTAIAGTLHLNLDGAQASVPGAGVVDVTYAPCQGAGQSCAVDVSRFDAVAAEPFELGGALVTAAQVQMQGRSAGRQSGPEFLLPSGSVRVEGNFTLDGERASVHASNDHDLKSIGSSRGVYDFDVTFGQGARTLRVDMAGSPVGTPPTIRLQPNGGTFECACENCTTVTLQSTATDAEEDIVSASWFVDGVVSELGGDALSLALPVGAHDVKLVAMDGRGAASFASAPLKVVDTTPPTLTAPPNVVLRSCDYPRTGRASAEDVCSTAWVASTDPGDFMPGVTTVTWYAEDEAGNLSRATQRVTVTQVEPSACCPPGYNVIRNTGRGPIIGTSGNDCIIGSEGDDVIEGRGGEDYIVALGGQDRVSGGPGNDVILGGEGDDTLDGGDDADQISGGGGQDKINAGAGNDQVHGGRGDDVIRGGVGDDELLGGDGQDTLLGEDDDDILVGGLGDDQLDGAVGNDQLFGGATQDRLQGGVGGDIIVGDDGDDTLEAGPGSDLLAGGKGHNRCSGDGSDRFLSCETRF